MNEIEPTKIEPSEATATDPAIEALTDDELTEELADEGIVEETPTPYVQGAQPGPVQ